MSVSPGSLVVRGEDKNQMGAPRESGNLSGKSCKAEEKFSS